MAYKTRPKIKNIKAQWDELPPSYITDKNIEELQIGGSQKYGDKGGCWINETIYQSIGGYRSRGGMPLKLRLKSGKDIPISTTDAEELYRLKYIRAAFGGEDNSKY